MKKKDTEIFKKEIKNFSYLKEEHIQPTMTIDNGRGGIDFKDLPDYYIEVEYELVEKNWKYQNIFKKSIDIKIEWIYDSIKIKKTTQTKGDREIKISIEEKIALLKYAKRELRYLLNEDKYLEVDFIADELGVNKKEVLKTIKNLVSEKGKQRREFKWISN